MRRSRCLASCLLAVAACVLLPRISWAADLTFWIRSGTRTDLSHVLEHAKRSKIPFDAALSPGGRLGVLRFAQPQHLAQFRQMLSPEVEIGELGPKGVRLVRSVNQSTSILDDKVLITFRGELGTFLRALSKLPQGLPMKVFVSVSVLADDGLMRSEVVVDEESPLHAILQGVCAHVGLRVLKRENEFLISR